MKSQWWPRALKLEIALEFARYSAGVPDDLSDVYDLSDEQAQLELDFNTYEPLGSNPLGHDSDAAA